MRPHLPMLSKNCLALCAAAVLSAGVVAACSSSGSGTTSSSTGPTTGASSSPSTKAPITIGASLSMSGDFSGDGQFFKKGYQLWASDVNAAGGLLGRQVKLTILNDNSSPAQAQTNYQTLFSSDKVDLAFGPFSSLLTTPSASVAARFGYAMIEGAGGAPSVFASPANQSAHNIFDVSLPIVDNLIPFVNWVASLPASQRPKTAAYPMADDPFADPPVQLAQQKLQALGVKTVYSKIFPAEVASYKPAADQVAATGAQAVVLGPGYANQASQKMVQEYVAKYGGTASDIGADVAEGYAVGQVAAAAVTATGGTDNAKIITYLHSGVTLSTVQGSVKFDSQGENGAAAAFIFQWQTNDTFQQVLPLGSAGSVAILATKPNWAS